MIIDVGIIPPNNQEYLICEIGVNRGQWVINKPTIRAVANGKIQNGRAIFSYTDDTTGELIYVLTNGPRGATSWGGKVQAEDIDIKSGPDASVVNAAKRETFEELRLSDEHKSLVLHAKAIILERPDAVFELNRNVITTKTVVLHLGKLNISQLKDISPSIAGEQEGMKGFVHISAKKLQEMQECDFILKTMLLDQQNLITLKAIEVQADQESKISEEVWSKEKASLHEDDGEGVVIAGCEMPEAIS